MIWLKVRLNILFIEQQEMELLQQPLEEQAVLQPMALQIFLKQLIEQVEEQLLKPIQL